MRLSIATKTRCLSREIQYANHPNGQLEVTGLKLGKAFHTSKNYVFHEAEHQLSTHLRRCLVCAGKSSMRRVQMASWR